MGPQGEKCGDCYYWEHIKGMDGICRFSPPPSWTIVKAGEAPKGLECIPTQTHSANDWCGSFKPIKSPAIQ